MKERKRMVALGQVAVNEKHLNIIETVKERRNVPYYAQVMRWAVDALERNPEVVDVETGPFNYRLPTTTVTPDQIDFIEKLAVSKGVSRSQIVRDAIRALSVQN